MPMSDRDNPNRIPSYDICDIVSECAKVHPPTTLLPQPRDLGKSENPIHDGLNILPEPQTQPWLLRLIIRHGGDELPFRILKRDLRHLPSCRSMSRSTSANGRPLANPESILRIRRSISSSHAASAPTSPDASAFSRRVRANLNCSFWGKASASSAISAKLRFIT